MARGFSIPKTLRRLAKNSSTKKTGDEDKTAQDEDNSNAPYQSAAEVTTEHPVTKETDVNITMLEFVAECRWISSFDTTTPRAGDDVSQIAYAQYVAPDEMTPTSTDRSAPQKALSALRKWKERNTSSPSAGQKSMTREELAAAVAAVLAADNSIDTSTQQKGFDGGSVDAHPFAFAH